MDNKNKELLSKVLFDTINDPILIHPLKKGDDFAPFFLVNKAACELYEYTEEEFYKLSAIDIVKVKCLEEIKENLRKYKKYRFERVHITKSGKNIPVDINSNVISNEGELFILSVVRDITEKKQYEQKLIEASNKANNSAKMLENVINTIPARIFWKDMDLNYIGANQLFADDTGVGTIDKLIGRNDHDLIWKAQAEKYREDDRLIIKTRNPKINFEEPQDQVGGSTSWLRTTKIPLIDEAGNVTGILGTYEDITLRKEQELALKNTQKDLLHAQEVANLGYLVYDIDNRVFEFSDEVFNISGLINNKGSVSFETWEALLVEEEKALLLKVVREAIEKKSKYKVIHRIKRVIDKEVLWINTSGEYFEDENGKGFLRGIAQDITKFKNIQLELEKHKNNLEELVKAQTKELENSNKELITINKEVTDKNEIINKSNIRLTSTLTKLNETQNKLIHADKMSSLGILTAGISHELNNPLNFIQGGLMGLKTVLGEQQDKPEVSELLEAIDIGVLRASKIITGLNHFNRSNDNYNETCDLHSILNNVLVMLNSEFKHKIIIDKTYYSDKIVIKGNVGKLHQVFVNLLSNAKQAIEDKGIINISTNIIGGKAIIIIKDSGSGISKEALTHVFDPFFTTKEPGKGIGLGLSISYSIIKEHKGTIEFKSEKGKGTTAIIMLPN